MNALPSWIDHCIKEAGIHQDPQLMDFLARGLPTKREDRWKYTDLHFLQNSDFALSTEKLSTVSKSPLPQGVILCSLEEAIRLHPEKILSQKIDVNRFPFACFNQAFLQDATFLFVPKNTVIAEPIHFLYRKENQEQSLLNIRHLVIAEENTQFTMVEEYLGQTTTPYFHNVFTDIYAAKNANITLYKIQNEGKEATHIATLHLHLKAEALIKSFSLGLGGRLVREDIQAYLEESGASVVLNGLTYLNLDNQHLDNHLEVDHLAKHTHSEMLYKGIYDKKSHGVFNGKIHVHPGAQKTKSIQANHNLLLSVDAAIDTKPELEIDTDDIQCRHGDTVGQIDREALFYLRSRGISQDEAMKLMLEAFASDVMKTVENEAILKRMKILIAESSL